MVTTRRHILLLLFKTFDLAVLAVSFIVASVPFLNTLGASSLTEFLSIRTSVRNFVLFGALMLLWHYLLFSFGLYESKRLARKRNEAVDVFEATALSTLGLFVVGKERGLQGLDGGRGLADAVPVLVPDRGGGRAIARDEQAEKRNGPTPAHGYTIPPLTEMTWPVT